jgi:hypothetical protein
MKRKCLAIGIILLFVGIACSPITNARNNTTISKPFSFTEKNVSIIVQEYKPDGTIEKSVVKLSKIQAEALRGELNNVKDLDTRLSIYKKYHLIPQDVTDEKLRLGMEEYAQRFGPEIETLQNMTKWKNNNFLSEHFSMNFFCKMATFVIGALRFLCGLSFITSMINSYLFNNQITPLIPSIDLFQISVGFVGVLGTTNGTFPDSNKNGMPFAFFILGFVGYCVSIAPHILITEIEFSIGYAVAVLGVTGVSAFPTPVRSIYL